MHIFFHAKNDLNVFLIKQSPRKLYCSYDCKDVIAIIDICRFIYYKILIELNVLFQKINYC